MPTWYLHSDRTVLVASCETPSLRHAAGGAHAVMKITSASDANVDLFMVMPTVSLVQLTERGIVVHRHRLCARYVRRCDRPHIGRAGVGGAGGNGPNHGLKARAKRLRPPEGSLSL